MEKLAAIGHRRVLHAGALLVRQFDPPGPMYVLESGQVRVLRMQPCSDVLLASIGRGAHVGELSALLETSRNATVQALTEAVVIEISASQMRELIRTEPSFARTTADPSPPTGAARRYAEYAGCVGRLGIAAGGV